MAEYQVELNNGERLTVGHEFLFRDRYSECVITAIGPTEVEVECGLTSEWFEVDHLWPGSKIVGWNGHAWKVPA